MKNFFTLLSAFISLLFLNACQKNIDGFIPDINQSAPGMVWQNSIAPNAPVVALRNELRLSKISDSFPYNNAGAFFIAGNLAVSVPAGGLINSTGIFPIGIIKRESLFIHRKGDFITMGMPTVSNGRLLVSGGAYFIGLRNNNDDLFIPQGKKLTLHYNIIAPAQGMQVFNGTEDITSGFNWLPNTDTAFNNVSVSLNGYEVRTNRLKWLHTARLFDTAGIAQTSLSLKLPPNYTNANTLAYISFNDMQCVAAMYGNPGLRTFVSGNLPVNRQITVVVISKQEGDYYLGRQVTNTSGTVTGASTQELNLTPVKTPFSAVKTYLETL